MSVYEVEAKTENGDFAYATLVYSEDLADSDNDCCFNGVKQGAGWKSPLFEWQSEVESSGKVREKGNFAYVFAGGLNLAADNKARELLEQQLGEDIEFLPLEIKDEEGKWFLLNVTHVVENALSLENSKFKIRGNGSLGRLTKAVFDAANIPDDRPFVYPQWINAFMFKGDKLKALVEDNDLVGLSFDPRAAV